ncbi:alkaline phosphatase family protein [bacterium AH-315-K20]|nr:alkaline phosphatase family protein [bacterium AH-315-K20]
MPVESHRRFHHLLSLLALAWTASVCAAQGAPKLLFIGIDGVRPDALLAAGTPAIDSLIERGVLSTNARCEDLTFSGPNWSTILHGVHRDRHTVTTNDYRRSSLADYPDLFEWLERHNPEWTTVRITTWDAIYKFQPTGADIDIFYEYSEGGDQKAAAAAAALLAGTHPDYPDTDVDAMFLYIADVDNAGHAHGFHPEQHDYLEAISVADGQVGQVLDAMRDRAEILDENWLVILTTDHGGSMDKGHSGNTPEKRTIPFLVSGRDVVQVEPFPAPRNVDGVTTALAHMGVPITPEMQLDGRVVGLDFPESVEVALGTNLVYNSGAEMDRGMHDQHIHQNLAGWNNPGPYGVTVIEYGSSDGYPSETDPGPSNRGRNFFCGGASESSTATQRIDLSLLAEAVDSTRAVFTLSAYLGGYTTQGDRATVRVRWLDRDMQLLGVSRLGPVTASERENQTGLFRRETTGTPPSMARWAEVEIECVRGSGAGNDGYVDEVSLVITMPEPEASAAG